MAFMERFQRNTVLLLGAACLACAPAPHEGELVHIAEESAIILWDAATRTQHFIRSASFQTDAKDFGFLVPTPNVPELAEASDEAFAFLDRVVTPPKARSERAVATKAPPAAAAEPKVVVIATARVAGMDAAVLAANDAGALDRWLKEHGYASSGPLMEWAKAYIDRNWYITAFKIAAGTQSARRVEAGAIRMSFKAEQPFFPYREPNQPAGRTDPSIARLLKVYFVADGRYDGALETSLAWAGRPAWSGTLAPEQRAELMRHLRMPADAAPGATRLTYFRDLSDPRPGADLNFTMAANQSEVRPDLELMSQLKQAESNRSIAFWLVLLLAGGAVVFTIVRGIKRKDAKHG